jgi:hypothetical protein
MKIDTSSIDLLIGPPLLILMTFGLKMIGFYLVHFVDISLVDTFSFWLALEVS